MSIEEFDKDWADDSISLRDFCNKYGIDYAKLFPECEEDEIKYG